MILDQNSTQIPAFIPLKNSFRSILLCLCSKLLAVSCSQGFQQIESFDALPTGSLTTVSGAAWSSYPAISQPRVSASPSGGKHVSFGRSTTGGPFVSMSRLLPQSQRLPVSGFSTFFFRIRPHGARIDHSIGLADELSTEPTFGDLHPQIAFVNGSPGNFRILARSGNSTFEVMGSAPKDAWYDIWVVTDRARGMYDVWYSPDGQHPILLANDYLFRTPTTSELSTVLVLCNGQNSDNLAVDLDDFYVQPGRVDFSHPSRPGIQPAALRIATFNTRSGNGASLASFRDNYLNGEHVICLQEIQQSDWNAIQNAFPNHPHRLLTVKSSTKFLTFKTECIAILSSLPFLETDAKIIQIDPQGDRWQRWAQYVKVDLGGDASARIFHYHNTYNFDANNFESEKSGMMKFRDWILQKTNSTTLAAVPDLIALGDFNLTTSTDVLAIMPMPLVHANGRDYLMANPAAKSKTTLWTNAVLSDHNGLAASLVPTVPHERYGIWASAAFTEAELRAGLGAPFNVVNDNGLTNFNAYALNLNPWRQQTHPSSSALPTGVLHFRRGMGRSDVRFTLDTSSNLTSWQIAAVAEKGGPMTPTHSLNLTEAMIENGETILTLLDPSNMSEPRAFFRQGMAQ